MITKFNATSYLSGSSKRKPVSSDDRGREHFVQFRLFGVRDEGPYKQIKARERHDSTVMSRDEGNCHEGDVSLYVIPKFECS